MIAGRVTVLMNTVVATNTMEIGLKETATARAFMNLRMEKHTMETGFRIKDKDLASLLIRMGNNISANTSAVKGMAKGNSCFLAMILVRQDRSKENFMSEILTMVITMVKVISHTKMAIRIRAPSGMTLFTARESTLLQMAKYLMAYSRTGLKRVTAP